MKNLIIIFLILSVNTAKGQSVTISGTIANQVTDSVFFIIKNDLKNAKGAGLDKEGSFDISLNSITEITKITLLHGNEITNMLARPGDSFTVSLDTEMFDETVTYTGDGSAKNNYSARKVVIQESLSSKWYKLPREEFSKKTTGVLDLLEANLADLANSKEVDSVFVENERAQILQTLENFSLAYDKLKRLEPGNPSHPFSAQQIKEGEVSKKEISLADLRGSYVLIDVWATWCGPCKRERPFFEELVEEYSDRNIVFVGMSIDKEKDKDAWIKMVEETNMQGLQMRIADEKARKDFLDNYYVKYIPLLILIDPDGNIVNAKMPLPSSPKMKEFLESLI